MGQAYMLRLYDTDMLAFSLSEQGIEGLKVDIQWINDEKRHLLPLWIWNQPILVFSNGCSGV